MAAAQAFAAEPVVRVKAKLTDFDGQVMQLEALPARNGKAGEAFTVSVTPQTRYVGTAPASLSDIKADDYVSAAVSEQRGVLSGHDVYRYADALRGSGEGRFPEGERLMINGTVTAVKPATDSGNASLTLHYHGAILSGTGTGRTVCEGRSTPPPFASALACEADAVIQIRPATRIWSLSVGDKDLLKPGALVTVAMTKAEGDKSIGVGVVVEPQEAAKNQTVEKPQSSP